MSAQTRRSEKPASTRHRTSSTTVGKLLDGGHSDQSITTGISKNTSPEVLDKAVREHLQETIDGMRGPMTAELMTCLPGDGAERIFGLATEAIQRVAPKDPLERMLVEQLVWCHERVRRLALKATSVSNPGTSAAIHAQCDATMNTYRRGMMALRQYRAMATQSPLVAIQQVNEVGGGQVVVNAGTQLPEKA